ncbi:MAG: HAD family hydrolase [Leptospiraceae bacterium]|nr:HAD family hydrolase [Leptospiraceae bacterium]
MKFPRERWETNVYETLLELIESKPGLACFDFDNTIIKGDLGEEFMREVLSLGLPHLKSDFSIWFRDNKQAKEIFQSKKDLTQFVWNEYEWIFETQGLEASYRWSAFLFSGFSKEEQIELTKIVWEKAKKENRILVYPEMSSLIEYLKHKAWIVKIVTASPETIIQTVSEEIGISQESVYGMQLETDGIYFLPKLIEPYPCREGKVNRIKKELQRTPDLSLGDSINDEPMLRSSTLGIFLNKNGNAQKISFHDSNVLIQNVF